MVVICQVRSGLVNVTPTPRTQALILSSCLSTWGLLYPDGRLGFASSPRLRRPLQTLRVPPSVAKQLSWGSDLEWLYQRRGGTGRGRGSRGARQVTADHQPAATTRVQRSLARQPSQTVTAQFYLLLLSCMCGDFYVSCYLRQLSSAYFKNNIKRHSNEILLAPQA